MNKISDLLDYLWGGELIIENIDFCNKKIHMKIKIIENELEKEYALMLNDVISFCWINDQGEDRKNIYSWNYMELESISLCNKVKINVNGTEYDNCFYSRPSIMFEVWNSALYVEASEVIINDISYKIR